MNGERRIARGCRKGLLTVILYNDLHVSGSPVCNAIWINMCGVPCVDQLALSIDVRAS